MLPPEVEKKIVERIYADAARRDWGELSVVERSLQYETWVNSPAVGGLLTDYMSASQARLWIKDGPMKEWARARSGVGKYAPLVSGGVRSPTQLVTSALGSDWSVDSESLRIKPLRILAHSGDECLTFTWGPARDLKHLVWAALQASANGDPTTWVICVVDSFTKPVPANVRLVQSRIAARCDLRLVHVTA